MTFYPTAADRRSAVEARTEGLFARMLRLWIEHNRRMLDLGIRPY